MNKKMSKRQRDLKSKLMAAICMLLVSSIMMVSTTYAWFTLSTAPEVTGITTAVGANGNLEMALLPTVANLPLDNLDNTIQSSTGDSMDAAGRLLKEANITWGNLVDLQDNNTYGLDRITLYPAALNIENRDLDSKDPIAAGNIIGQQPLGRPVYGADGRVASLKADTISATFASGAFSVENTYGVRAIGTSSNMSARELEHRSLLSQANSNTNSAKSLASGSLETHGATLAGLAIRKVNASDGETVTVSAAEVVALQEIADSLNTALTKIELALRYYAAANAIAAASDSDYVATKDTILADTTALSSIPTDYPAAVPSSYSAKYAEAVAALAVEQSYVSSAKTELDKISGETTWDNVETHLNKLVNTSTIQINGVAANEAMSKVQAILDYLLDHGGIHLTMGSGSGAFATIADFCGDYSTFITLPTGSDISAGNITADLSGRQAVMKTATKVNPAYLVGMESGKAAFTATAGGNSDKSISDFYGYIIDLAFRTNAANSDLLLQTEAVNRIYEESTANEAVMGHGSSMTFISGAADFSETSMKDLMKAIRIVFFDPSDRTVIAEARLDADKATVEGGQVTAKLYMYKGGALQNEAPPTEEGAAATKSDSVIVGLDQNKAKAVSVLVYLDGHSVTNKDVAATGSASMTGSMNLQFASSANLKPMNYTDLMQGEGTGSGTTVSTVELTKAKVDTATAAAGISVRTARYVESGTDRYVGVILGGTLPEYPVVTIKVGDAEPVTATAKTMGGISGYAINVSSTVAADTAIEVSVTAGTAPVVTEYTVTASLPTDVTSTGTAKVNANTAYAFVLTNASEKAYTVSYSVAGVDGSKDLGTLAAKSGENNGTLTCNIPSGDVTGNITITFTEST